MTDTNLVDLVSQHVDRRRDRLIGITRDLIRIPSENTPPRGAEHDCQEYIARVLRASGVAPDVYDLTEVQGLAEHPLFVPGREYKNRPNVGARIAGNNGGRSLVLSGHIDTVPRGTQPWTRDPFGAEIDGNRIYGRGSNDMKAGVATNLFVVESLRELGLRLQGDLLFESVVDEEFGGVNGTIAGRVRGFNADAAVISEPSFLRVCPAQRGGRIAHITFRSEGGILTESKFPSGAIPQLTAFLARLPEFASQRRARAKTHELYAHSDDPVPVSVTKVFTAPWGTTEPITPPESCKIELYWQLMPGEQQAEVEQEFFCWLDDLVASAPETYDARPEVEFPIRWLPGSAILKSSPIVSELAGSAEAVTGEPPPIVGIEGPCDMYVFQQAFGTPAVLWGARGGNTHAADEYVEIDSMVAAAKALLLFVCRWCRISS